MTQELIQISQQFPHRYSLLTFRTELNWVTNEYGPYISFVLDKPHREGVELIPGWLVSQLQIREEKAVAKANRRRHLRMTWNIQHITLPRLGSIFAMGGPKCLVVQWFG